MNIADHARIHATILANNAAVAAGDLEGVLATFAPDGVLVGQAAQSGHSGQPTQGTAALRAAFGHFMAISPRIDVTAHTVTQAGDLALHTATWTMTTQAPDGSVPTGSAFVQNGFSVVVLRRQPDDSWLMVIDNPFGDALLRKD